MKNFEELKEAIRGSSFNESHLSSTQVVDLETVIGLIEDFEQCNIDNSDKGVNKLYCVRQHDRFKQISKFNYCPECGVII